MDSRSIEMSCDMYMLRPPCIMSGIKGCPLSNSFTISLLKATSMSCIDVSCIGAVSISSYNNTTVYASGVGIP